MLGVHYELSWNGVSANHGHISTFPQFSLEYEQGKLKSACKIPGRNHLKMYSPYITPSLNNPLLQSFIHLLISTDNWKVEQLPTKRKKSLWKKSLQDWGTSQWEPEASPGGQEGSWHTAGAMQNTTKVKASYKHCLELFNYSDLRTDEESNISFFTGEYMKIPRYFFLDYMLGPSRQDPVLCIGFETFFILISRITES